MEKNQRRFAPTQTGRFASERVAAFLESPADFIGIRMEVPERINGVQLLTSKCHRHRIPIARLLTLYLII